MKVDSVFVLHTYCYTLKYRFQHELDAKSTIETGKAILGIELGSTRIKAVLIDQENKPIAQGSHTWENQLVNGLWTYSIDAIWSGLQDCYADLRST